MVELTATNLLEEAITLDSVSSTARGVNAEIVQSNERDWKIKITAIPLAKSGKLSGTIQLNFSSGLERVRISGSVRSVIAAIPDQITLRAGGTAPLQRLVMLKSQDARAFDILSVKLTGADGTMETKRISENRWQCGLTIIPSSLKPGATVQITTSCSDQPSISVPLNMR